MPHSIGVDQGLSGGLCWLTGLLPTDPQHVITMPTRKAVGSNRPDTRKLKDWVGNLIREYGMPDIVVIERTQAMGSRKEGGGQSGGQQSPKSLVTQGFNAGIIVCLFEFMDLPIEEPAPQTWKAAVLKGFGKKDKDAMITVCRQRFPQLALRSGPQAKKDHDGMADAVGLALFGQYRVGNVPT